MHASDKNSQCVIWGGGGFHPSLRGGASPLCTPLFRIHGVISESNSYTLEKGTGSGWQKSGDPDPQNRGCSLSKQIRRYVPKLSTGT